MIPQNIQNKITAIWDKYITDNKIVQDTKGNDLENIDEKRIETIDTLKTIINNFLSNKIDVAEFKTNIDSINKQNNYWGFTSVKGQMFFNLLLKTSESEEQNKKLTELLKVCITEPKNLTDALNKIETLDKYSSSIFNKAPDKRKAPNPGSICYFLSYFWQIQNHQLWPVMYSSIIVSFTDIGLWVTSKNHREAYNNFYNLNEEIKQILSSHTGRSISNWEAEHSFWNFRNVTAYPKTSKTKTTKTDEVKIESAVSALAEATFNIYDFIPPISAKLIELGIETESSSASKGTKFEKAVCEVFRQLGFDVQYLGQGTGREPDLIAIYKVDNIAFIIDAKAYANGYMLSASDERAMREYILHYCPKLKNEGFKKVGFIIVSNTFKPGFEDFINDITWNTEIKRFSLLDSSALLHLLAYKIKDQLPLNVIIDAIVSLGSTISAIDIIQKLDDI
jgi:hypothetical protein